MISSGGRGVARGCAAGGGAARAWEGLAANGVATVKWAKIEGVGCLLTLWVHFANIENEMNRAFDCVSEDAVSIC